MLYQSGLRFSNPPPLQLFLDIGYIEEFRWRQFVARSNTITRVIVDCQLSSTSLNQIKLAKQTFGGEPFGQLETLKSEIKFANHETFSVIAVPSLTSVFLSCVYMADDGVSWVANDMPVIAPNITHFGTSLHIGSEYPELSRHLALKYLELRNTKVTPHFWKNIASCQLLRKIVLTDCTAGAVGLGGSSDWRVDFVHFPALCTLKMRFRYLPAILRLLSHSRMPMLECLWWDTQGGAAREDIDQLATQLKLYSPKLDTDTLYCMGTGDHSDSANYSDNYIW